MSERKGSLRCAGQVGRGRRRRAALDREREAELDTQPSTAVDKGGVETRAQGAEEGGVMVRLPR